MSSLQSQRKKKAKKLQYITLAQRTQIREARSRKAKFELLAKGNIERSFMALDRELEEYYMTRKDSTSVLD